MSEPSESLNGARVRFLLLGLIIGASAIVAFTNNSPSFGTADVVQQAMPSASTLPGAIASAVLPRNLMGQFPEAERIPEVDVSRLPKAAPDPSLTKRGAGKAKKKADGEEKKAAAPKAPAAGGDDGVGIPPGFEQVLEGMQGFGKAFKGED